MGTLGDRQWAADDPLSAPRTGRRDFLLRVAAFGGVGLGCLARTAPAADYTANRVDPFKPDTSSQARANAVQSIPYDKLNRDGQSKVSWVLANTSVFRRLPVRVVQCDPDLYLFLLHHPDVVVNIWEALGLSHLTMRQLSADVFQVSDDIGTAGSVQFLYRSNETNLAYVDGVYTGSLFKHQIRARGILVIKSGYMNEADGRCYVTSRLDAFMNVEPGGAEFLTRTFLPMVGKVADNNFLQTAGFLGSISRTAEVNQAGMQRLAKRLNQVQPEVRQQFAAMLEQVGQKADQTPKASLASQAEAELEADPPMVARGSDSKKE